MIREVPGCIGYGADEFGNIYTRWVRIRRDGCAGFASTTCDTWKRMRASMGKRGYLLVNVKPDGKSRRPVPLHVLVLLAFSGPRPEGHEGCHQDGNRSNNTKENLRWDTKKSNAADSKRHGTDNEGVRHPLHKLTEESVRAIRSDVSGGLSHSRTASRYGVSRSAVGLIVSGKRWRHLLSQ